MILAVTFDGDRPEVVKVHCLYFFCFPKESCLVCKGGARANTLHTYLTALSIRLASSLSCSLLHTCIGVDLPCLWGLEDQDTLALPCLISETIHHLLMILNPKLGNTNSDPLFSHQIHYFLQIIPITM
jgi:hypothetical protein